MYNPIEVTQLLEQSKTGNVPPSGNLLTAQEIIGFSFGIYFDAEGQLGDVGPVNRAIASFIVADEVLRSKYMTLQEELAIAIEELEPRFANQIDVKKTIKKPGLAYNTHEILMASRPGLMERNVGSLAVVAFRHHLPRAAAQVRKADFQVATPDMSGVGDFDPDSPQQWIHNQEVWTRREQLVIPAFAVIGRI